MRTAILYLALVVPICATAQTQPQQDRPKKVLTPEQTVYQQQMKAFYTEMDRLHTAAKSAYTAEMAREKAGDCPNAATTIAINQCLSREDGVTEANYKAFTTAVRAVLALPQPTMPGTELPTYGSSGLEATPATDTRAFDAAESAWQAYAKAECSAVDVHWRGGTIVNSMIGQCHLRVTRARMDQLASDYMTILE